MHLLIKAILSRIAERLLIDIYHSAGSELFNRAVRGGNPRSARRKLGSPDKRTRD